MSHAWHTSQRRRAINKKNHLASQEVGIGRHMVTKQTKMAAAVTKKKDQTRNTNKNIQTTKICFKKRLIDLSWGKRGGGGGGRGGHQHVNAQFLHKSAMSAQNNPGGGATTPPSPGGESTVSGGARTVRARSTTEGVQPGTPLTSDFLRVSSAPAPAAHWERRATSADKSASERCHQRDFDAEDRC